MKYTYIQMVKNSSGGNKAKKQSNKGTNDSIKNREIAEPEKDDDSRVGVINKVYGDLRYSCNEVNITGIIDKPFNATLSQGTKKKYGRGIIITVGTYVLYAPREFNKKEVDIIFIYRDSEIPFLVSRGHMILVNKDNGIDDVVFTEDAGETLYSKNEGDDKESKDDDEGFEFV